MIRTVLGTCRISKTWHVFPWMFLHGESAQLLVMVVDNRADVGVNLCSDYHGNSECQFQIMKCISRDGKIDLYKQLLERIAKYVSDKWPVSRVYALQLTVLVPTHAIMQIDPHVLTQLSAARPLINRLIINNFTSDALIKRCVFYFPNTLVDCAYNPLFNCSIASQTVKHYVAFNNALSLISALDSIQKHPAKLTGTWLHRHRDVKLNNLRNVAGRMQINEVPVYCTALNKFIKRKRHKISL